MTRMFVEGAGYRLEFQHEAPRLRVHIIGGSDTRLAITGEYWLKIAAEARARGAGELLVVDAMQGEVMTDAELEGFFRLIEGHGLEHVRIAYVEGRADQISRIEIAELMARERGYDFRAFNSETDAVVWLRHGMR